MINQESGVLPTVTGVDPLNGVVETNGVKSKKDPELGSE
jgi:hypothetical protein